MSTIENAPSPPIDRARAREIYPDLVSLTDARSSTGATFPVIDPCTEEILGRLPLADADAIESALTNAGTAFRRWAQTPAAERASILLRASELLRARSDQVASLITLEEGKRLFEARADVTRAADNLAWFAGEAMRLDGRIIPPRRPGSEATVIYEPIGPVAAFTPWNGPVSAPARKIATALAAGCSCVIKPAEEAPASALAVAGVLREAGLPDGVLAMVFGDPAEVATQLVRSPHTQAVSFTGSTRIGQEIARLASDGVKRLTLELGGHAPVVVFSDADVEETVALAVVSKFERNAGQVCISPSRFFVEAPRYAEFVDRFVAAVEDLKVGDGFDPSVDMGPLANPRRLTAMTGLVEDAAARGATIAAGGGAPEREGFFFSPTVVLDPPPEARVMREEPFGPLATITPVADRDEAITRANELPFGLAAYGFTRSMETAHRFFTGIEAGIVGLNSFDVSDAETPFGGMKLSGYGSEGGIEGIRECLVTKYIYRRWSPPDAL